MELQIFAIALMILFGIVSGGGGEQPKPSRRRPTGPAPDCGPGKKAQWNATLGKWECVLADVDDDEKCTPGQHLENGVCVDDEPVGPPPPQQCPAGQVWSAAQNKCIPKPTIKPPDDETECVEGTHWDDELGECVPDEPVFDPDWPQIIKPYPAPGFFYQVKAGDQMLGVEGTAAVTWRALAEAGTRAAIQFGGMSPEQAFAWGKAVANRANLRLQYKDATLCGGWVDRVYETFGWCDADCFAAGDGPGINSPGPHGRAVRFLKQHPDNASRLAAHQQPIRNMRMLTAASEGKGNGTGAKAALRVAYELLWLPAIDLELLWDSGGTVLSTQGQTWPDGSSKSLPPPWVRQLGLDDQSGSNLGLVSGCAGSEWGGS